jgi:hypothetical protein
VIGIRLLLSAIFVKMYVDKFSLGKSFTKCLSLFLHFLCCLYILRAKLGR